MNGAWLADLIVALHLLYVLFVITGLLAVLVGAGLGWGWVRNRRFRWTHLVCTAIVPLEALAGVVCPLTSWERALRVQAGQPAEEISFVGRLVRDLLYYEAPEWVFTVCYVAFATLVVATFRFVPPRRRGERDAARAERGASA